MRIDLNDQFAPFKPTSTYLQHTFEIGDLDVLAAKGLVPETGYQRFLTPPLELILTVVSADSCALVWPEEPEIDDLLEYVPLFSAVA